MPSEATSTLRVPTQSRAQRTRDALVRAAAQEFSGRGYAGATAKSIAKRARVAVGSFYQYFENKDALLREIATERLTWIHERTLPLLEAPTATDLPSDGPALSALVRAGLQRIVEVVIEYHREDPGLHAVLTERRHADPELERATTQAEHALVERIASLLSRWGRSSDPLATAFVVFGAMEGSVHAHVLGEPCVSETRFVSALVDALLAITLPGLAALSPTP